MGRIVTLTIISSAAISSVFSKRFSTLRTFRGRPCSLWTIALNSRGIDTVSPCTPHPSTGVLSHRTNAARLRRQASPSIKEGIRASYVFAVTALVSLQNRSPLSFLDNTLGSLSQAVRAMRSGATKTTSFVKTTLNGAANVYLRRTANGGRSAGGRNRLVFPVGPNGFVPAVGSPWRREL